MRLFASIIASLVIPASALAQSVVNGQALAPFFARAHAGRVDVVGIGDSNETFGRAGWDDGWSRALTQSFGVYATGLISAGDNQGQGSGAGSECQSFAQPGTAFQYWGAPTGLDRYLNSVDANLGPLNYLYLPEGSSASASTPTGLLVFETSPVMTADALRFHFTYGLFSFGSGSFRPSVRIDVPPYTELASGEVLSTYAAGSEMVIARDYLDVPPGPHPDPLALRFADESPDIAAPFIAYYTRAENTGQSSGASFSTLYGVGGKSARDMAGALMAMNDAALTLYFSEIRRLQQVPGAVLVRVCTGLNDRNIVQPSIAQGIEPGNSAEAYKDNLKAIVTRVRSIWVQNNWPDEELFFLITPSHPIASPDDDLLMSYRKAADELALELPRTASVRLDRLTTESEMEASGWYIQPFDHNHLTAAGYTALAARELETILPICSADFDQDGDIATDADIEAFFACLAGTCCPTCLSADFDGDGDFATDKDIESFFRALAGGPC